MICAQVKPAVSGLEKEFPGKVTARNIDATTPEAREAIRALGLQSHGLVIQSRDGTTLWKQSGHNVRMSDVERALHEILGT